jgi:hypothetical protein
VISRRDNHVRKLCWFASITIMSKSKSELPTSAD